MHSLIKVYTRCCRSVAELVVLFKTFDRVGLCITRWNDVPSGIDCKASQLSSVVQCAVDAAQDISALTYAADGGVADTLPIVTLDDDGAPYLILVLHTTNEEVAYTQCPFIPAMINPCAPHNLVNQSRFCTPELGLVASAWLTKYAQDQQGNWTWLLVGMEYYHL
ncbi:hypothetical protein DD238_003350 [Peronospora effusa]|uniref:Uncharacterized protein n=1 Tax=Peronospora effusa TaxID=542832 RepID=A0A3M6VT97_9STRA|nr:hypothetical protein DD238_003350 [Peronospora effusa]